MSEICNECALVLFKAGYEVYELHEDGTESLVIAENQIKANKLYGVE